MRCKYECSLIVVGIGWRYNLQIINDFAGPILVKIIAHEENAVGFLLGFPDVYAATQKHKYGLFHSDYTLKRIRLPIDLYQAASFVCFIY